MTNRLFALAFAGVLALSPFAASAFSPFRPLPDEKQDVEADSEQKDHVDVRTKLDGFFNSTVDISNKRLFKGGENNGVRADGNVSVRIENRIDNLETLLVRIENSDKLSDTEKEWMTDGINAQISVLQNIEARVEAGESKADVKTDLKTALKAKIHAMPKAAITAAGERILAVVERMETLAARLEARIDEAADAGRDVTASVAAHADLELHIADAKADAQTAIDLMANLSLDRDDMIDENRQTLLEARSHIADAKAALTEAREDIGIILDDLDISFGAEVK